MPKLPTDILLLLCFGAIGFNSLTEKRCETFYILDVPVFEILGINFLGAKIL